MEEDDDIVVIIVEDGNEPKFTMDTSVEIKQEVLDEEDEDTGLVDEINYTEVEHLIQTAEKHGQVVPIENLKNELHIGELKEEPLNTEYLDDFENADADEDYEPNYNDISDEEYISTKYRSTEEQDEDMALKQPHRYKMLKPSEQKSFVKELRANYPELKSDKELLVETLCEIMRNIKAPSPPRDYFIMNGIDFECVICGALNISQPAASRHWQEKHGTRYLVCFACGVDFRSTTNLYKHEKRCNAPDAVTVLKARALSLGRKGRSRPFMPNPEVIKLKNKVQAARRRFACSRCPAVYITKASLQAHEYVHNGLRPFRCKQCSSAYTSRSALSRHASRHSDVQYICDHCSRPFKTKTALIAHLDTHRPLRKFPCELCGRRYAQKMALQLHIDRAHLHLPPPCACQICPKRYPRMSLLKTHMLKEHGMNLITRNMLYKSLPTLSETQLKQAKIVLKSESEYPENMTYTIEEVEPPAEETVINEDDKEAVIQQILQYQSNEANKKATVEIEVEALEVEPSNMPEEIQQVLYENRVEFETAQPDAAKTKKGRVKNRKQHIKVLSQ